MESNSKVLRAFPDDKLLYLAALGLPWRDRVKLSVDKLEEGIEETRRDLLLVGV